MKREGLCYFGFLFLLVEWALQTGNEEVYWYIVNQVCKEFFKKGVNN
jgi:hypothetical protein